MATTSTTFPAFASVPSVTSTTTDGVSHIDLAFASAMTKGAGSIFVTDGVVQTVIDRATGLPAIRVVGATMTREIPLDQVHISGNHVLFDAAGLTPGLAWNVYMGAGTLLSAGRPHAGLSAPGQAAFSTPAAVEPLPSPPSLGATIALDGTSLKSGEDIVVTISFSKAVAQLNPALLTAANAIVKDLATHDGGLSWHATLTGKAATDAPGSLLRLDLASVVAVDGSRGAGVVESAPYAVDTVVAAWVGAAIDLARDTGPYRDDGVSNDDTMAVSGLLYGSADGKLAAGQVFELVINGRTIDPAAISISETASPGVFAWSWASATEHFAPDENTVQARIVGAGHSSPAAARTIVIDTVAPAIAAAPAGPVDLAQAIQITFNEKMYWDDKAEVQHDIRVVDGFGNTSWIDLTAAQLSEDRLTLSLRPGDHDLAAGNSYQLYLPQGLSDLAGNAVAGPAVQFATAGLFEDKAAPRLLQAYLANGNGLYGKDDVLEFRLRYNEKVQLESGAAPRLDLSNGAVATYAGLTPDGTEMRFTYTVAAGDDAPRLDLSTPWSLEGKVRDLAGNVMQRVHIEVDGLSSADGGFALVALDTVVATPGAPRLHAASDSGTAGDAITTDTTPRLDGAGAEAGATVSLYADGVLAGTTIADSEGRWNLTPSAPLGAGSHRLTASQQDLAGNVSALSAGFELTILTLPATLAAPVLQLGSDSGVSASDRVTADNTPTLSGSAAPNSTLKLERNGAGIALVTTDASGNWSYTPAALEDGAHGFTVRYVDVAGHAGALSSALSIKIDTNKPNVIASPHGATAFATDEDIVIGFDEALYWNAGEGEDALLVLEDGNGERRSIRIDSADFSSDGKTLTLRALDHELLASTSYRILLPATLSDLAGNRLDEYEIAFHTASPAPYAGPSVDRVLVSIVDHTARAGETIDFRIRFDGRIKMLDDALPALGLSNGKQAQFTGISEDGKEMLFRYVVQPGDDTEHLTVTDTRELPEHVGDLSGNPLDLAHTEFSGLYDAGGELTWLNIDTLAPDLPALPQLDQASNSGSNEDLLTNVRTPTLTGMAQAGERIEIYEGATLLGATVANDEGAWQFSIDAAHALADGLHGLSVKLVDAAGNSSQLSAPLALTIDTAVAALSGLALAGGADSGISATDGLTSVTRPGLRGTGAEAGATIRILAGDTVVGTGTALLDGSWSAELDIVLADGVHAYRAQQVDAAGNASALSAPLAFTIDTTAPAIVAAPLLAASSDSGLSANDGITSDTTPLFTGSGAEAGATVVVLAGTRELGRGTVSATGHWSIEPSAANALADATHAITVHQIDKAGNTSVASGAFSLVVDTVAPGKPALPELDRGSHSGHDNGLPINDRTPTLEGTAEAGARIEIYEGATLLGSTRADSAGKWEASIDPARALADGLHSLHVKQVDLAGNSSVASNALSITIDTTVAALAGLALANGSDTGISPTDGLTSATRPVLTGLGAEAGATIRILAGSTVIGTGTALPDGSWSATLDVALPDGAYSFRAQQVDAAGNVSALSAPLAFTVDATAPAVLAAPVLAASSDSGLFANDGITSDTTPLFTGSGAEAGATVVVLAGTRELGRGTVSGTGSWSIAVGAADALANATHAVTVYQIDKAGNTSGVSNALSLVIDTLAPGKPALPALSLGSNTGLAGDPLTSERTPALKGTAEAGARIEIHEGATFLGAASANSEGEWEARIDLALADGLHTLSLKQVDLAGNVSDASDPLAITIDTVVSALSAPVLAAASDSGLLSNDGITSDTTPLFTGGGAEAGATVVLLAGTRELGRGTADAAGNWSVELSAADALANAAHAIAVYQIDMAGNASVTSSALGLVIDTVAPGKPALPALSLGSNSGLAGDLLTSDRTPTLEGLAEAGARIEIYEGDTLLGSTLANGAGVWEASVGLGDGLADGPHKLSVKQVDLAGNVSAASDPLAITIDTLISALSGLALADGHDTGISLTDGLTSFTHPDFKGTGAEAGAAIRILAGSTVVGTGTALLDGNWSAHLDVGTVLADGAYSYRAQQVDAAGNVGALTAPLAFTVDATAPGILAAPLLAAASDSGLFSNDGITNDTTPLFTGSGAEAGATVVLKAGTQELGRGSVDGAGNWSVEVSAANALASATYGVTVHQIDKAGNAGAASNALNLVIDTVRPTLLGENLSTLPRQFQLKFSEEIVFAEGGRFDVKLGSTLVTRFLSNSDNWTLDDGPGGQDSVLNFGMGLSGLFGLFKLHMHDDAIVDLAGNVAKVVGQPEWDIDFPLLSGLF